MNKLFLDLKVVSSIPNAYLENTTEIMGFSGANIGNFAFRHALSLMAETSDYKSVNYSDFNKIVDIEQPASVIISCANWLCASEQYETSNGVRAATFEKLDCPITVFGLGAQASSGSAELKLGPNTIRLAKVIAEKSVSISVRDEFTHTILNKIGITNVVQTGCPSNFINLNPALGHEVIKKATGLIETAQSWADLRTHFSEFSGGHKASGSVLKKILGLLNRSPSFYVIQSPVLFPFLLKETKMIPKGYIANKPESIENIGQLERLLKSKLLHFSSIDAWLDFARTCDLSLGMRIHGNMIPLQAGVPSMVIGHDSRTSGLSKSMGIPVITPEKFITYSNNSPASFFEEIALKMEGYDKRRSELAKIFVDYIEENNLVATQNIKKIYE